MTGEDAKRLREALERRGYDVRGVEALDHGHAIGVAVVIDGKVTGVRAKSVDELLEMLP